MLISPLAKRLCVARGIAPETLKGSGPRGRIMSCDVKEAQVQPSSARGGHTVVATDYLPPTRPEKDGYFVYDCEVDMLALASMSLPIAVQCERLLAQRYSLMDYIVRAVIKSCRGGVDEAESMDVLLFESAGQELTALADLRQKTIYQLAEQRQEAAGVPQGFIPNIVICDSNTTRDQVRQQLEQSHRTRFALAIRGGSPKVGIRVGCKLKSAVLSYTFYISSDMPQQEADHIAARLSALLYDPVSLLMIA